MPWVSLVAMAGLLAAVIGLQHAQAREPGATAPVGEELLYVRSPEAMQRIALSYDALLADIYWIRAIQHYGGTRLSGESEKRYELLYPLLDLTTSLDPHFRVAYLFGSIFLAEPPPGGPGRPDQAIELLSKGLRTDPTKWEYAQAIGFVHYWWRQDYNAAAEWFRRASLIPNAPIWMAPLAATTLAQGGSRASSRLLWQQIAETVEEEWYRNEAARRLQQLDAMEEMDRLREIIDEFRQRYGGVPATWNDLGRAGYLLRVPVDPTGVPYRLESGVVMLGEGSRLFPLPVEPPRIVQ